MDLHGASFWIGVASIIAVLCIFLSGFLFGTGVPDLTQPKEIITNTFTEKLVPIDTTITITQTDDGKIVVHPSGG